MYIHICLTLPRYFKTLSATLTVENTGYVMVGHVLQHIFLRNEEKQTKIIPTKLSQNRIFANLGCKFRRQKSLHAFNFHVSKKQTNKKTALIDTKVKTTFKARIFKSGSAEELFIYLVSMSEIR